MRGVRAENEELSRLFGDVQRLFDGLRSLEGHYEFFRCRVPMVAKVLGKPDLSMHVSFGLDLFAGDESRFFGVDFERGDERGFFNVDFRAPHNYLEFVHDAARRTTRVEAQEQIHCDPSQGYRHVMAFLDDRMEGGAYGKDLFSLRINDDLLIFDDHDRRHQSFRGWTGGYDPSYAHSFDARNLPYLALKLKWDADGVFASLERRINTMKLLFDGINARAGWPVREPRSPVEFPDYGEVFAATLVSEPFEALLRAEESVRSRTGYDGVLERRVVMGLDHSPRLVFQNADDGALLYVDAVSIRDDKYCCEVHLPRRWLPDKPSFSERHEYDLARSLGRHGMSQPMRYACVYVREADDIPAGLDACLSELL